MSAPKTSLAHWGRLTALLAMCSIGASACAAISNDPRGLLLTWQRDPLTTMTIDWHTVEDRSPDLQYRQVGTAGWHNVTGASHPFPFSDRIITGWN